MFELEVSRKQYSALCQGVIYIILFFARVRLYILLGNVNNACVPLKKHSVFICQKKNIPDNLRNSFVLTLENRFGRCCHAKSMFYFILSFIKIDIFVFEQKQIQIR